MRWPLWHREPRVVTIPMPVRPAPPHRVYSDKTYEVLGVLTSLTTRLERAVSRTERQGDRLEDMVDRLEEEDESDD